MKLSGEYVFAADVQEVWDALFDPSVLAAVLPGCEKLELVDGSYLGEIKVKVGPIQGKFTGKVDLLDQVPPKSYRMVIDGKGAQGFVKATARIALEPQGTSTKITYDSDAQVGGKIATVGERLIETSAKAIVKQSLEGLGENVVIRAKAHREAKAASEPTPIAPTVETVPVVEPAPAVAAVETAPGIEAPAIQYKRADASKLASAVAKEVGKTYAPIIGIVMVVVAIVIYLIVR
jgi:carbon monoxide dehydrogenase subunit G